MYLLSSLLTFAKYRIFLEQLFPGLHDNVQQMWGLTCGSNVIGRNPILDWLFEVIWTGFSNVDRLGVLDQFHSLHAHIIYRALISFWENPQKSRISRACEVGNKIRGMIRLRFCCYQRNSYSVFDCFQQSVIVGLKQAWRLMVQTSSNVVTLWAVPISHDICTHESWCPINVLN